MYWRRGSRKENKMNQAKYWSCNEYEELLTETSIDDAVQQFVDNAAENEIPNMLTVYGFNPVKINKNIKDVFGLSALENMVERLDEDFGNPDDDSELTEEMKVAAKDFSEKIIDLYHVFRCEQVDEVEINMVEWCKENDPELIPKIKTAAQINEESTAHLTTPAGVPEAQLIKE
jgi:hypothetical protein